MAIEWVLLGVFIWIAFTSEAITGFGSIVIAVALGSMLFPIPTLLPILVPLSVVMTTTLIVKFYRDINFRLLLRRILPFIAAGMALGIVLLEVLSADSLKLIFAALIVWFAGRELYKMHRGLVIKAKPSWWQPLWTFFAGITHGLFASGGPLLVYSLNSENVPKAQFRATLVSVWFGLNVVYASVMFMQGKIQPVLPQVASYLPVLALSFWVGHSLHKRVSETQFKKLVYWLLLLSAATMFI
ncbi:sulfite exporter TauE/SafE family protein [Aliidiomarina quisquiliarum]|uniref:sulfite exporter TauE/SafE family protein n=1 Tax=Aliidiomarina quisquiliarum TaxID=2938947 RepID=UPI00208EDFE3|nr:sulfite exporter TauE/SafE family protein [Aliidiomarina quisquiliarum]MCO4322527.1 sulfite exporter TauE/SafE family protein [Aliidiomarina quisquiliarum]